MNKSNNNNSQGKNARPNQPNAAGKPRNPVQGRGRGPRPQSANRDTGKARLGASMARPPRGQVGVAAAYATGQSTRAPLVQASRDQARIVHRELIGSMTGSGAFAVAQTIPLNPGLPAFAPWLASQAQGWERYRFNKLRFCYYTRTGSNVPGSMMLVPDYDAADAAPASEQIASSYEDVEEDAPWKDICCVLRAEALHALGPSKFIRTAPLAANLDIKTYDAGNLFACTVDGTAVSWGKLWVEYDVTLITPQLGASGLSSLSSQHVTSANPTTANMLGTQVPAAGSTAYALIAGEVLTFQQAGKYLVVYAVEAGTATQTGAPALSGAATFSSLSGLAANPLVAGSATASMIQEMIVNVLVGTTLTFNNTLIAGATADLKVVPLLPTLG